MAPVKLKAVMSIEDFSSITTGHVSAGYAELVECLIEKPSKENVEALGCVDVSIFL